MAHTTRTATLVVLLVLAIAGPAIPAGSARDTAVATVSRMRPTTPRITVSVLTEQQAEWIGWAVDRFSEAGLELPDLTVTFHASNEGCGGFLGYYRHITRTLDVCNEGGGRVDPIHTVLHELAHAWSFHALDSHSREAWSRHRGVDGWHVDGAAWWQQGLEQAAEVVAWGLMDAEDPFLNRWVIGEPCDELATSFRLLTGSAPLHDSTESCR